MYQAYIQGVPYFVCYSLKLRFSGSIKKFKNNKPFQKIV